MPRRLKSLELHGYKTFANRTLFEFGEAVTAIVGPNGSGKSNIADSLRWVLGEQSYGLLRAKKTEDMIFSGSESRPRSGLALATIVFDNADNWLPIDFSEVAITRRAYRDGNNEYLLNGQRVRLKVIGELLSATGLAERTYTIIGQGLVDAALALKADERRRLFEEAAGIGLHRARREEAIRRLDTTNRNLERVQDILAELEPRLHSLERQARRAQEYEQVRADLNVLLRDWYGFHWNRAQRELAEALNAARAQEARLEQARAEQATLDERLGGVRRSIYELRERLNGWRRELASLHTQRESLTRSLAITEERLRTLQEQQRRAADELLALDEELHYQREQVQAAQAALESLAREALEARRQVDAARQALQSRLAERSTAEADLSQMRRALANLNERHGQAQARLAARQAQRQRLEQESQAAMQALQRAEVELRTAQEALTRHRQVENQARQALRRAQEQAAGQRRTLEQVEIERRRALDVSADLQQVVARLQTQLDVLQQAEAAYTGYAAGTRVLLQAAEEGRLPEVLSALNRRIQAPAEIEPAIAAALGEYLDAVLLSGQAESAFLLLESADGRAALLPLTNLRPSNLAPIWPAGDPDVLGIAADLVSADAAALPAVQVLLGQALVVRHRQAAYRLAPSQPPGVRLVTLKGEIFHASGAVLTAGSSAAPQSSLLGRARQIAQMNASLEGSRARLEEARLQAQRAEAQAQNQRTALEGAQEQERSASKAVDEAAQQAHQTSLAVDLAARNLEWQRQQVQRLQDESAQAQAEATQLASEIAESEQLISQGRERARHCSARLEELSLDEFQAQLAHWNTLAAVAERAIADSQAQLEERQAVLQRTQRRKAALEDLQTQSAAQWHALQSENANLRQQESLLAEQIQSLQAQVEPTERELSLQEQSQLTAQEAENLSRQAVSAAEHLHAQMRILLARRQEALQTLRRNIEDDFGLVAFEYFDQVTGPTPLPLGELVEQLPVVEHLPADLEEQIKRQRAQLRRMGPINPEARLEYEEVSQRHAFMLEQVSDLRQAEQDVRAVINELDELMAREFRRTFEAVAAEFRQIFTRLFGGGSARLTLTDPDELSAAGIDIEARLPGRRMQGLSLLSGGERSLTAVALIFALLRVSPTPFCVLDEVDAMLDEVNVGRFRELLRELSQNTQFVIITHNRNTVQVADVIYGVTMGRDSTSQVLSLKLDEIEQVID